MKTWAKSRPAPRLAEKACAAVIAARGAARSRVISLQSSEHAMEEVEYVATGNVAVRGGEAGDIRIGSGECGGAQIEARWEALDDAANDALRVAGLDLALDRHGKLAEWALGSEHMGDVAESVLVLIEPAIRGDVDAPARHVLAVVCVGSTAASGSRWWRASRSGRRSDARCGYA